MSRRLRVVIAWQEVNGYMAACWRALQKRNSIELTVVGGQPGATDSDNKYTGNLLNGLKAHLFSANDLHDKRKMYDLFRTLEPNVIFLPGWSFKGLTSLTEKNAFQKTKFVMGFDTPRLDTWRQKLAWIKIGRLVGKMSAVVVPGERGYQFAAKLLKVPESKIWKGLYGCDYAAFAEAMVLRRDAGMWPKRFLYLGRLVKVKGIHTLLRAYAKYRASVKDPWALSCYGSGPFAEELKSCEGIQYEGFAQPAELCGIFSRFGAFVLPSRLEPWGVVIAEAGAAGLPIVCSHACGASVELVRPYYNGVLSGTDDAHDLCRSLMWIHNHYHELPEMGRRSQELCRPYSAESWADRWEQGIHSLESN